MNIPSSSDPNPAVPPVPTSSEDRMWAMAAHLSAFVGHFIPFGHILGPLVIWLVKRETSWFVADQAKEALNAQISVTIYAFVGALLVLVLIGIPLLLALWLADIIFVIVAALAANEGKLYRYPLIFRLVK
jgi:uncharacterized Tic20 family protein